MGVLDVEDVISAPPVGRTHTHLAGTWRNPLGSVMVLEVEEEHLLRGTFRPAELVPGDERTYLLRGFAEGTSFAFCVDFGAHGSVASWTGHRVVDASGEALETLWHLAKEPITEEGGAPAWGALLTGSNRFERVE